MNDMQKLIAEVAALGLKAGDVLVIKPCPRLPIMACVVLQREVGHSVPAGVQVMVLDDGAPPPCPASL